MPSADTPPPRPARAAAGAAARFACAFVLISLALVVAVRLGDAAPALTIRAGILADLLAERPEGRQGLVCSLWFMPLPVLPAMIFAPWVRESALALAHLYGAALVLALAVGPAASLLARLGVRRAPVAVVALWVALAAATVATPWADTPACLAILVVGVSLDLHGHRVLRALSGTAYGLALLAHPAGLLAAVLRLAGGFAWVIAGKRSPPSRAVEWVRAAQIAYAALVYLFLCHMIMGDATYPFRHTPLQPPRSIAPAETRALEDRLRDAYPDFAPVVSGLWGHLVQEALTAQAGHRFVDFHAERLPTWERRDALLILPTPANPLHALSDLDPRMLDGRGAMRHALRLEQTPWWAFYQVSRPAAPHSP